MSEVIWLDGGESCRCGSLSTVSFSMLYSSPEGGDSCGLSKDYRLFDRQRHA